MKKWLWIASLLLAAAWPPRAAVAESVDDDPRVRAAAEEVQRATELLAGVTNEEERALWQKRVELAQRQLENARRLVHLEQQEHSLARAQRAQADFLLRQALLEVDTDVEAARRAVEQEDREIRRLKALRAEWEERLRAPEAETDEALRVRAETEARLRVLDAELQAHTFKRQAADLRARVAQEAARIESDLASWDLHPQATLRLLNRRRHELAQVRKSLADLDAYREGLTNQMAGVKATYELARERFAHLDDEVSVLSGRFAVERAAKVPPEQKSEQAERLRRLRRALVTAEIERGLMRDYLRHLEAQRLALEEAVVIADRGRQVFCAEQAFRETDLVALRRRFLQRVAAPLLTILALALLYEIIIRRVLPRFFQKDALFVARRLARYVLMLLVAAVLTAFFLEDLKAIATFMGIVGAAIVIALQELCLSFAGWFAIIGSRKIRVGDRVEIDQHRGDVLDIQILRTTLLEINNWLGVDEPTGRVVVIPNSFIFRSHVFNYSHVHPFIWGKVDVTLTFESPPQESYELLLKILREETRVEFEEAREGGRRMERHYGVEYATYEPRIHTAIAESGVTYSLMYVAHYRRFAACRDRICERVIRELEKHPRIAFAYPTERHIPTPPTPQGPGAAPATSSR